jgi:hypothetical protein
MPANKPVVAVWLCPASNAIASTGTPCADSSDTKVCRSSRGPHSLPSPAASVITRNCRRTLWSSSGVPTVEANTSPRSCHSGPAASRSCACPTRCSRNASAHPTRQRQRPPRLRRLRITPGPVSPPHEHRQLLVIEPRPRSRASIGLPPRPRRDPTAAPGPPRPAGPSAVTR